MSAAGRDSPVSRKRRLGPALASPAACSGGGAGGSGIPKAKRRLFAADPGSRCAVPAAVAAEVDRSLRRRQLAALAGSMAAAALSYMLVMMKRRKYSTKQLAPLREAIVGLASALHVTTAPVESHPDLYPTVMAVLGFTDEQLLAALSYLNRGRSRGAMFLAMSKPHHVLWIEQILAKQEL